MARRLFALSRALIVAPLFISIWTYFVPRWIVGNEAFANPRPLGWTVVAVGALIALPCIWEFAWRGLGTPVPFDPPRRLVVSGPYRWVRNPMYLGMGIALLGEAIVFPEITLMILAMVALLWGVVTALIVFYEEPTLHHIFGDEYGIYRRNVRRWLPRLQPFDIPTRRA